MKISKKRAFTLIELIIAITIFFIMVTASFVPYNHYMNKQKVRNTIKEISQILYEARNMAINGASTSENISIGVFFDTENNSSNEISIVSFPHYITENGINISSFSVIKKYTLQPKINITEISGQKNGLFFFKAITGDGGYYYFDLGVRNLLPQVDNKVYIDFSYNKAAPNSLFSDRIEYFTITNIVDY